MARGTKTSASTTARTGSRPALTVKTPSERAPALTKDELRARVEKLERANATLRAKGREANKAAKSADMRMAELEAEVARLERRVAAQAGAAKRRGGRGRGPASGAIDPGDAVPPGVAVMEPAPLDAEAETALENLEKHLGRE